MEFFHIELIEQFHEGHIAVFPLAIVANLDKLWISPLASIPQRNRQPRMINYFTWSGLNTATGRLDPQEEILFRGTLKRTMRSVLEADPSLGPVYLIKLELANVPLRPSPRLPWHGTVSVWRKRSKIALRTHTCDPLICRSSGSISWLGAVKAIYLPCYIYINYI